MDQEVVARVDFKLVVWADEARGGALLDQERAVEAAARSKVCAVIDRHFLPAVLGIDPHRPSFAWLERFGLRRSCRRRRPVEPAAADDAKRGDVQPAARLDVTKQALVFGFEGTPGGV